MNSDETRINRPAVPRCGHLGRDHCQDLEQCREEAVIVVFPGPSFCFDHAKDKFADLEKTAEERMRQRRELDRADIEHDQLMAALSTYDRLRKKALERGGFDR